MNPMWFMRAKRWSQNPPSWRKVKLVLAVIAFCVALFAIERFWGWPDALTVESVGRRVPR